MSNDVANQPQQRRMPVIRQQSSLLAPDPAALNALGGGIRASFPVLSIDGKKWTAKWEGKQQTLKDTRGEIAEEIELVILDCPDYTSKVFYPPDKPWTPNSKDGPRCRSNNGVAPDKDVIDPISPTCGACKNNERGSRIWDGKALKACADTKRLVVVPAGDILNEPWGGPMLLRVPAGSLKALRQYGDDLRDGNALFYGCVTSIRFTRGIVHQRLIFEYVRPLSDDEVRQVLTLKSGNKLKRILESEPAAVDPTLGGGVDEELIGEEDSTLVAPPSPTVRSQRVVTTYAPASASGDANIQESNTQSEVVHPDPVQSPPNPVGFGKPPLSPHAPQRPAGGIPPAPATTPAATPVKAVQTPSTPQQPAARAVAPSPSVTVAARPAGGFRPTSEVSTVTSSTKPKSEIGAAISTPAEPPVSTRQVVAPPIPDSQTLEAQTQKEEVGVSLPDELDLRFGELMSKV